MKKIRLITLCLALVLVLPFVLASCSGTKVDTELQINVTDKEALKKAKQNPEEYRDLIVRIGGHSDYFTKISPEMQDELILRTEHKI